MELKYNNTISVSSKLEGSNCTFMELKSDKEIREDPDLRLF